MAYDYATSGAMVPGVPGPGTATSPMGPFSPYGEPVTSPLFDFTPSRSYGGLPRSVGPWNEPGGYYGGNPYTDPPPGSVYTSPWGGAYFGLSPLTFDRNTQIFGGDYSGPVDGSSGHVNPVTSPYDIDPNYDPNDITWPVPRDDYTGDPDPDTGGDIDWGDRADYWTGDGYDWGSWLTYLTGAGVPTSNAMAYLSQVYQDYVMNQDSPWNLTIDPFFADYPDIVELFDRLRQDKYFDPSPSIPPQPDPYDPGDGVVSPSTPDPVVAPTLPTDPVSPIFTPPEPPDIWLPYNPYDDLVRRSYA